MNPYEILHLRPGATDAEIQQAYRDLVKVWHPDRFGSDPRLQKIAEQKLSELNQAYRFLESVGRVEPDRPQERVVRTSKPIHWDAPRLPLSMIWAAVLAALLTVLCISLYRFLEAPMNALSSISADARRVARQTGPSIIDEFRGWNGILPPGLERLLHLYQTVPAPRNIEISRGSAPNSRKVAETRWASLLRSGFGEIRVWNRTGDEIQVTLATTRAQAVSLRTIPLSPMDDGIFDGLGPDIYLLNVTFQDRRRRPMRLGPFMMVEIQSGKGFQADQYEIILKPIQ